MLPIILDPTWTAHHPKPRMGVLVARGLEAGNSHPNLEQARLCLETELRERHAGQDRQGLRELPSMKAFCSHFKPHGKTYHVLLQLESVALKGRAIPTRMAPVTALFMSELKHGLVAAGHDLNRIESPLTLAVSRGGETYQGLGNRAITAPSGDLLLRHQRGILSSILHGPDEETPIREHTQDVLYTIYAMGDTPEGILEAQLESLSGWLRLFSPKAALEHEIV